VKHQIWPAVRVIVELAAAATAASEQRVQAVLVLTAEIVYLRKIAPVIATEISLLAMANVKKMIPLL